MNKHMQLTVTVRPYYQKDLEGIYPKVARLFGILLFELNIFGILLHELVGQLDQLET